MITLLSLVDGGHNLPYAAGITALDLIEEILLVLLLPEWRTNGPGIWRIGKTNASH